ISHAMGRAVLVREESEHRVLGKGQPAHLGETLTDLGRDATVQRVELCPTRRQWFLSRAHGSIVPNLTAEAQSHSAIVRFQPVPTVTEDPLAIASLGLGREDLGHRCARRQPAIRGAFVPSVTRVGDIGALISGALRAHHHFTPIGPTGPVRRGDPQRYSDRSDSSAARGLAPRIDFATLPSTKTFIAGIDVI